ncbi:dTDP-4-dehydrorhamnose reductase [Spongiactinospora sp. TRM90649]|uniref:dTDP-4-dehydrorhamnose reductase n=1 Tax=Spongiactinospora sp. TRM90649 TaxID=3031114 RepID=UPI0023F74F11|nr:dTDP-4-dehydrorhamnose reductase [Spongiactinospora sp. TRM90649]MDF5755002.1 dTDP-4-dehydrorhamnose reductase [Spongiactinospora sp. TRM90649]
MRWLVTGGHGMLGTDLVELLRGGPMNETGYETVPETVAAPARDELDVCDPRAVAAAVEEHKPDVVVNCAGWTAVDAAEGHEAEARAVNGDAVASLAAVCAHYGARLIQISTDYVFDGTASEPYPEGHPVSPVNAYGRGKLAGERAALAQGHHVVRTAWLYGAHGRNFVRTMMRLAAERDHVTVVDDQIGQPTWTGDLVAQLVRLARADAPPGVYHGTNAGRTTWHGFAREIFAALGADPDRVRPIGSERFPLPARRPAFGVLGHEGWARAGLSPMRDWRAAFRDAWPSMVGGSGQ